MEKFRYLNRAFLGFELDYLRPLPEAFAFEFEWLDLNVVQDMVWDYKIELNHDQVIMIRELMQRAQGAKLAQQEQQMIIDLFNQDQKLITESGINPRVFPQLVEFNSELASFIIAKLNECVEIHE